MPRVKDMDINTISIKGEDIYSKKYKEKLEKTSKGTVDFKDTGRNLVEIIVNLVKDYVRPKRILLFGSRACGKGKKYSDFDIAVEGAEMDIRKERSLKDALDDKLGIFTFDLINLDKVDDEFRKIVLRNGRIIYG